MCGDISLELFGGDQVLLFKLSLLILTLSISLMRQTKPYKQVSCSQLDYLKPCYDILISMFMNRCPSQRLDAGPNASGNAETWTNFYSAFVSFLKSTEHLQLSKSKTTSNFLAYSVFLRCEK